MLNKKAFTLIELLVVIAIVGILSGFIFVSMNGAVNSAKDARRQADLASIQHAILAYMAENNNAFPESSASCTMGSGGTCSNLSTNLTPYIKTIPLDPNGTNYTYTYSSSTSSFTIQGTLSNGNTYYYDSSSGQWSQTSNPFVGWLYKKTVTLSSSLTQDYQIKLTIPYGSGGCESHCKSDFSDLRFASTSGTTLNYWIESYTASTTATVWVKALNTSSSFVMYYGKSDATTTASGDNTFLFFDDFSSSLDTNKWYRWSTNGTSSVSGGILTVTGGSSGNYEALGAKTKFSPPIALRQYVKFSRDGTTSADNTTAGLDERSATGTYSGAAEDSAYLQSEGTTKKFTTAKNGVSTKTDRTTAISGSYTTNDILWASSSSVVFIVGSEQYSATANIPADSMGANYFACNSQSAYVDWVLIRSFMVGEPTPSIGAESSN